MKNADLQFRFTLLLSLLLVSASLQAQMRVGPATGAINGSASLEVVAGPYTSGSPYRGLLLPTLTTTQRSQIQNPATGLLIFNSTTNQVEVNTGTSSSPIWTPGGIANAAATSAWSLTGNTGTNSTTNFLGTRDNVPLKFRVNNSNAGRIEPVVYNTAMGMSALRLESTGRGNTALGALTLASSTTATYNTASGFQALYSTTTGSFNTATGTQALMANTTGQFNVAAGYKALAGNIDGVGNTAIGSVALQANTSGHDNTALGQVTLSANTTGNYNTALGAGALQHNSTGYGNLGVGHNSLAANTTGYSNSGIGEDALGANTTGSGNVGLGGATLMNNTVGNSNLAAGNLALYANTSGNNNTASGSLALRYLTTGSNNTALGFDAGPLSANSGINNSTAIGANAKVGASNTIVLGDNNISALRSNVQTISTLSDGRIKEDVQANVPGLSFISKLRPVTYHVNKAKEARLVGYPLENIQVDPQLHSGFIAQEVEAAAQSAGYTFEGVKQEAGGYYTVGYTLFVIPLVQSVKDLHSELNELKAQIKQLQEEINLSKLKVNPKVSRRSK